jgi:hypothetical protein
MVISPLHVAFYQMSSNSSHVFLVHKIMQGTEVTNLLGSFNHIRDYCERRTVCYLAKEGVMHAQQWKLIENPTMRFFIMKHNWNKPH